ncbi:MAG: hypothetical protein COB02_01250 [Candidatus Cloacimonadota bacterium]|nr:MAG: hypothetical protein COB02_01250 [Candidatus Cloacimonadota bacterium]
MFDKETIKVLKEQFGANLGKQSWQELGEQLLCQFLIQNKNEIYRAGAPFLDNLLKRFEINSLKAVSAFIKPSQKKCLIFGDELNLLSKKFSKSEFVYYGLETYNYKKKINITKSYLLDEGDFDKTKCDVIIILGLMDFLREGTRVHNLPLILKTCFGLLNKNGKILILDKIIYQDDFLCHFVSMNAEIESIDRYGQNDFSLIINP